MILKNFVETEENVKKIKEFVAKNDYLFPDPFSQYVDLSVYMNKLFKYAKIIYVEDERKVCGIACAYMNDQILKEAHLQMILVDKEHQGKGIGKSLCQAILRKSREAGMEKCVLTVDRSNINAQKLYEKLGYTDSLTQHEKPDKKYMEILFE